MEKEKVKAHRKRSSDYKRENLPTPPPDPTLGNTVMSSASGLDSQPDETDSGLDSDPFKRLYTYTEREGQFLKLLCDSETGSSLHKILHPTTPSSPSAISHSSVSGANESSESVGGTSPIPTARGAEVYGETAFESPNDFLMLLNRTGPSVAAALSTKGALDQLDRLHDLIKQLLKLQEQNMRMHWQLKNVETLRKLKLMQNTMNKDPESFLASSHQQQQHQQPEEASDNDLWDAEIEHNLALLETILAAGNTASNKRSSSKRERSKSVINEDISSFLQHVGGSSGSKDGSRNYPLRRQSAITDFKPKVSKWTKVKAAFKWEKTSALPVPELKTADNPVEALMSPVNTELARYLRVPSVPCVGSSGDSVFSSSSGIVMSGGSGPGTPGDNSLASSAEDLAHLNDDSRTGIPTNKRDSVKSADRPRTHDEESRRSKSLDGDAILDPIRQLDKNKNKSAWSKVKGIVKNHRGSLKSNGSQRNTKSSNSVGCSREASPCESMEACELQRDRSDSFSSNQTSPGHRNNTPTFLALPSGDTTSCPNSPCGSLPATFSSDDNEWRPECKLRRSGSGDRGTSSSGKETGGGSRNSRKSKHIPEIESVPEGIPIDPKHTAKLRKSPPKPLNLKQESLASTTDLSLSSPGSQREYSKQSPKRKSYGGDETSAPESPCKAMEFFEGELLEEMSSEEISDQNTPHRRASLKTRNLQRQRDEIKRRYMELQKKLQREFDAKQQEWDRIRPAALLLTNSPMNQLLQDSSPTSPKREQQAPIVEENLSPDFKKKLDEWRIKHAPQSKKELQPSLAALPKELHGDQKKKPTTDWQLWKTGQIKLEGQGLAQLPNAKDLPEDFQKKLSEWKQIKASNKGPSYSTQTSQVSEHSMKRQQSKPTGAIPKKPKTPDEHKSGEGLLKLKALVGSGAEAPKKELVVQTTKGFIKFEGISRKFTRRLFEWEKAKGIGPEASTIALLHPGYAPVVVENSDNPLENKREKSPALGRSLSMDSISPHPPAASISHQPSSLSLNDADELKEISETAGSRRISSNPELELSVEREEPRAVLVEVEDVQESVDPIVESVAAAKLVVASGQIKPEPGYSSRPSSNSSTILKDSTKLLIRLREQDSVDRDEVRRLKIVLRALIATLPEFVETGSRDSIAFFAYMKELALEILRYLYKFEDSSLKDASEILENVQTINSHVADLKKSLHSYMKYASGIARPEDDIPKISITPAIGAQATSSIQKPSDNLRSMATINVTPTFVCNAVRVNSLEKEKERPRHFPISSESDPVPLTSHSPDSSTQIEGSLTEDKSVDNNSKKVARNLSNGSRKKTRIKRMGSRQNSKTESDSSDESTANYVLEVPRKTKRKTSRAKKPSDSTEKLPQTPAPPQSDDVVFIFKIKQGQKSESTDKPVVPSQSISVTEEILISPTETSVEMQENKTSANAVCCTANVLVKTKRKIFSTVDGEPFNNSLVNVVSREVESSSTSDRSDQPDSGVLKNEQKLVINLPPLPQSPSTQRRLESKLGPPGKELSPNIRLMIAKYNQRLSTERSGNSPHSSGSCSPVAWRSPVLDRRVKMQTEKYQESIQISKSASAGSLRKSLRQLEAAQKASEGTGEMKETAKVVKSSSTGAIESGRQKKEENDDQLDIPKMTFLAYDSLRRKDSLSRLEKRDLTPSESGTGRVEVLKKERLYKKRTESPQGLGRGVVRKVPKEKYTRCRSVPGEQVAIQDCVEEKLQVTRKADGKPPSPRLAVRKKSTAQDASRSAPTTPLDEQKGLVPMSQRALKLRKAKEEFLSSSAARADQQQEQHQRQQIWNNRISQISMVSTSSADDSVLMKSASAGMINSEPMDRGDESQSENLYESLTRNPSGTGDETPSRNTSVHGSRFGLSNLASKLRKVKLRRSSKDLSKMQTISTLCRQSLMVDISGEAMKMGSEQNLGHRSSSTEQKGETLKKSGSVQAICNRFRKTNERSDELKKSRSLGFLEPDRKQSQ
ncbi:uncharacterized protein LOC129746666 isoform X2 [Uranotaenia lowii]|uniref:uncharacterized protein LOC129746666 isoform X2 n=1 Tax=Uranotaenia lowii TaxID=190385 RepID=UPI00247AC5CB|nr:uncharacterized protein LOC129746666 isoform X2 [Uranotaenia lowii]